MRIFQIIFVLFFFIKYSLSSEWNCTMIKTKDLLISNDSISEQCTISVEFTNTKQEKYICIARTLSIDSLPPLSLYSNHTMQTFRIHSCQLSTLGQLPFSLPSSVQLLDLRNNSLSTFILSFPLPSNLQYLYLDRNPNLTEINFGSNRAQQKLIGLSLRHNKKMQIPSFPPHLIELNLADCHLFQSPMLSLLKSLTNLTHLSLADNQLEQLPSIDESLRLKYLNLSNNHLTSIEDRWLHGSLQTLDLRYNRIQSLEFLSEIFSLTSNQVIINHRLQLFLTGNSLTCDCWLGGLLNTSSSIIINDLHLLQCHSRSIMNISNQNFLCSYSRHCASDCSCCDFEACDCHAVCPSDCSCSHDIHWSRHIVQCSQANLSNIHLLLPQTMTELNYQENHIEQIEPFSFVGKISLQKLNLAKNNLKNLTNETFCAANDLREINLSDNPNLINLVSRLNQLFGCLKHLQLIILSKNQMKNDIEISDGWMIHSSSSDTLIRLRRVERKLSTVSITSTISTILSTSIYRPTRSSSILPLTISFYSQEQIKFTTSTISTFIRHVSFIHHNQTLIIIVFFLLLFVVLFLILLITLAICRRKLRRHLTAELQRQRSHHYYYHTRLHPPSVKMLDSHAIVGTNDSLYEQLPSLSSDSEQPFLYNEKKSNHPNVPVLPPHPATFRHHLCCHAGGHLLHPSPTNIHEYQYATNLTTTTGYSTPTSQQHQCAAVLVWANRLLYPTQNTYSHHHDCSTHSCSSEMQHLQQRLLSNQQDQTSATTTDSNNVTHCCNKETIFLPTTATCRCNTHGQNTDAYIYPHVHR